MIYKKKFEFPKKRRGTIDITDSVDDVVRSSECAQRLCHLFIQHMSVSLIVCANADLSLFEKIWSNLWCALFRMETPFLNISQKGLMICRRIFAQYSDTQTSLTFRIEEK